MAIGYVQQSATADGAASDTIATSAMSSAVTATDCIVLVIESYTGASANYASSITDNASNTWPGSATARVAGLNGGIILTSEIWVLPNANSKSGYTVTTHFTTATVETRVTAVEFSGVATSSPVDTSGTAATAASGAAVDTLSVSTSGSITNGGDLLVTNLSTAIQAAAAGITIPSLTSQIELDQNGSSSICVGSAYRILSGASGVQTLVWNWGSANTTNSNGACIVALLPVAAAAGASVYYLS